MHRIILIVLLIAAQAGAQKRGVVPSASNPRQPRASQHATSQAAVSTTSSAATPASHAQTSTSTANLQLPRPAAELSGEAPVITLKGLCPKDKADAPGQCETTISKDQFEDLLSAVSLGGQAFSPGAIRNVADNYVQNLVLANAAEKAGVDQDPRIQELLRVVRLRTLAEAYRRALEEKYRSPSPDEIRKYYQDNIAKYETVRAERLMIPKFNPRHPRDETGEFQKKAAVVAAEIRERAVQGEPLDRLQNDAFLKLGITPPAIVPETGLRRRGAFPPEVEKEVFSLKPGEVSKVEDETRAFVIYRLIDKPTYTLDQVKGEIVRDIYQNKMEVAVKETLRSVKADFNGQYFAPPSTPHSLAVSGAPLPKGSGAHRIQPLSRRESRR